MIRNVFTLNTCAAIAGADILSFTDEGEMLEAWKEFLIEVSHSL
jgi:DNA polymerase delta subunit 1